MSEADLPQGRLHSITEAAQILRVGKSTLYKALNEGHVPHRRLPGTEIVRMSTEDIEAYLEAAKRSVVA